MARRHKPRAKHQGIDFVIGWLRKTVKDPRTTIAQRMKALDRLAVIDEILDVKLLEPSDNTPPPSSDPDVDVDRKVERMIGDILKRAKPKTEDSDGVSTGSERPS